MLLRRLQIPRYKNLRNLDVEFAESSWFTACVGENGSGKSNLIEALAIIFRDLDLDDAAAFDYVLEYSCRGNTLRVSASEGRHPEVEVRERGDGNFAAIARSTFLRAERDGRPLYRPALVFGYYSGPSDRLAAIFEKHRRRYARRIIRTSREQTKHEDFIASRRLLYAEAVHGQFSLLALMVGAGSDGEQRELIRQYLGIDGFESVLFALRKPDWKRADATGDPRFWQAGGSVGIFLSHLDENAIAPMRMRRKAGVLGNRSTEMLYLFVPGQERLERLFENYGDQLAFFAALESPHVSGLLADVRTRVRISSSGNDGEKVVYRDLSEGEQQLLLVLGMLKFTAGDEALFLLDEPDTHINPGWSVAYLDLLNKFLTRRNTSHIVMTTHDPLLFAQLQRREVLIFQKDDSGCAAVTSPSDDPRGMGVAGILTSDLFRLRSTLDTHTQALLDEQIELSVKEILSDADRNRLEELDAETARAGFRRDSWDPMYRFFLEIWQDVAGSAWSGLAQFTRRQYDDRREIAMRIVRAIQHELRNEGP